MDAENEITRQLNAEQRSRYDRMRSMALPDLRAYILENAKPTAAAAVSLWMLDRIIEYRHERSQAFARSGGPSTSAAAGEKVGKREGSFDTVNYDTHRHRILWTFRAEKLTALEACDAAHLAGGWRRVSDLLTGGFLEPTGEERPNPKSRSDCRVLRITTKGILRLVELGEPASVTLTKGAAR